MDQIESLISEYQSTVEHFSKHDNENLAQALAQDHDWSDEGARAIIDLGKQLRLIHAQKRPGPVHCPWKGRR
jgi:hypothetical protein